MAIKRANSELPDALDETGKAFERLGIKTKEQLRLSAQMALSDFETVRQSGQATQEQLQQAYEKTSTPCVFITPDRLVSVTGEFADFTEQEQVPGKYHNLRSNGY